LRWVLRASRALWGRSIARRLAFLGSEILLDEALANGNVEAVEYAAEIEFDEKGYRARFGSEGEDQTVAAYPGEDDGYYGDA